MTICNGIHLYEFESWIINKQNILSSIKNEDKTRQQIAESKFLKEVLSEIKEFINE